MGNPRCAQAAMGELWDRRLCTDRQVHRRKEKRCRPNAAPSSQGAGARHGNADRSLPSWPDSSISNPLL